MQTVILLLALFGIKHFVCDFVLQNGKMISDKATYGAPGGVQHAVYHAIGTVIVLLIVLPWTPAAILAATLAAIALGCCDGVIHYHIDYLKTRLSRGTTPADRTWWILFGADQTLHYLTYLGLISIIVL